MTKNKGHELSAMGGVVKGGVGEIHELRVYNENDEKSLDENLLLQEFARFVKDKIGRPLGLYLYQFSLFEVIIANRLSAFVEG